MRAIRALLNNNSSLVGSYEHYTRAVGIPAYSKKSMAGSHHHYHACPWRLANNGPRFRGRPFHLHALLRERYVCSGYIGVLS